MKNLKLTKKVQIVLASILIIAIVAIVVGTMFSNRASAATKPCGDSNCPGTMTASNYGVGTHRWHCNTCSYIESESCSGGAWTHKSGTEVHQKFCWACGYFYTQANCHDDNGDGVCEDCGWDGMHVHSYSTSYVNNNNGTHTEKHTCSCGDSYDGSTVSCSYGNKTSNGNGTHSATCTVCGYNLTEDCTEVIDEGKEATCTEEGLTEGKHCSVCGEILVAQEKIPAKGHNFEDGECTECGEQEFDEIDISSDTYEIENEYISKIQPETTVKEFKDNLKTNATEINIYNKENELLKDDDIIGTGMRLELKNGDKTKTFTLIVKGDVNGDGKADMLDIVAINKYRLNKTSLEEIYLKAGDVTEDSKVNLYDILKINKFRLNKIAEL